ncbi:MAG: hypothetical protein RI945_214 [Candidatus Parcubacteria bacterium]|jgi:hypothetical protein
MSIMEILKDIFRGKEEEKSSQDFVFVEEIKKSILGGKLDPKELNKKDIKKFVSEYKKNALKELTNKK